MDKRSSNITIDLDGALDRLLENAKILHEIQDKKEFALEKKALEAIQESLLNALSGYETQEESSLKKKLSNIRQVANYQATSVFRKRKIIRKSRKKQVV